MILCRISAWVSVKPVLRWKRMDKKTLQRKHKVQKYDRTRMYWIKINCLGGHELIMYLWISRKIIIPVIEHVKFLNSVHKSYVFISTKIICVNPRIFVVLFLQANIFSSGTFHTEVGNAIFQFLLRSFSVL